jgi:predicted nucleic acid-binding protein
LSFVDTNIFVRHLTGDDPPRANRCRLFFRALEAGRREAACSEAIIAEVVFVLAGKTRYALSRVQVRDSLVPLVLAQGLDLSDRWIVADALELYATTKLDFADALAAAHAINGNLGSILSYDKDFDKIAGLKREEP